MKQRKYKSKENKLSTYNNINSILSTLILINIVGVIVYEFMKIVFEKNYSSISITLSAIVMLVFNLFASKFYEAKKKDENKDNHWYPWIFELCIVIALPLTMNYFLKNAEIILMIIFVLVFTMHTVVVIISALYEYTLADIKGETKTFKKITLPLLILLIPILIEIVYYIITIRKFV